MAKIVFKNHCTLLYSVYNLGHRKSILYVLLQNYLLVQFSLSGLINVDQVGSELSDPDPQKEKQVNKDFN